MNSSKIEVKITVYWNKNVKLYFMDWGSEKEHFVLLLLAVFVVLCNKYSALLYAHVMPLHTYNIVTVMDCPSSGILP
jgi:hypothetical protein